VHNGVDPRSATALHAQFWNAPLRKRFCHWLLDLYEWMARLNITINASKRMLVRFERAHEVIPPRLYRRSKEVPDMLMRSLKINIAGPQTPPAPADAAWACPSAKC
jgi:hypothetical protein